MGTHGARNPTLTVQALAWRTADYLAKKIAVAQAQGKDVTTAKSQEAMGKAALRKGMNDEAARHFETAFRSIGVIPIGLDQDAGDGNSEDWRMRDAIN